ncbi:MAG: glycosyltransferase [Ruminococcus sp.]|nr:glycosyltransferase [Ruminococcus sp.]
MFVAVIVTYNRKELLANNIEMLLKQTKKFDRIFIIDNCSTDGTYEFLQNKGWINNQQFKYIKTESNIGGAGGFYVGTKAAYDDGADWIVLMDDDGAAADENTFSILYNKAIEFYNQNKGDKKLFINSLVQQGDMLSFKINNIYTVEGALQIAQNGIIEGEANPFNGTLVSRELVAEIGYPNKEFFIKGDEVNYKHRSFVSGAYVVTVVDSRYNHPRPETFEKNVLGKKMPFFVEVPWKEYYAARNFTWMYKQNKQYKAIAFELIFVKLLAIFNIKCKKFKTIKMLFKGVRHGLTGKLGPIVKP